MGADERRQRAWAAALGSAGSLDEVARAALRAALDLPGAVRAGLALDRAGGRQLQFVPSDAGQLEPVVRWCLIDAFDDVPLTTAVRTGEDVLLSTPDELRASYPMIADRQVALGTRSLAALALGTDLERMGGLLVAFDHEHAFDQPSRWRLAALAAQVTQALHRERLHRSDPGHAGASGGHTGHGQGRPSLPVLPELPGLSVSTSYEAGGLDSDVGGDWYDLFDLPDGSAVFALGDVMGKGSGAVALMGEVRTALRAYALVDADPSVVLSLLDGFVCTRLGPDQLLTLVYGVLAPDRSTVTLAVAGHPPPVLVPRDGAPVLLEDGIGPALGFDAGPWDDHTLELSAHDALFVYSDGVVGGHRSDLFAGMAELVALLAALPPARRKPRDLCGQVRAAAAAVDRGDDVTMLALAVPPPDLVRRALALPAGAIAPGLARRFVRDTLAAWGVDDDAADTAQLCVSELVTNAVIHGGTRSEVTVELDEDVLTVLVTDHGLDGTVSPVSPMGTGPHDEPARVSGRGLTLVEALALDWKAERTTEGTTVWFELDVSVVAPPSATAR